MTEADLSFRARVLRSRPNQTGKEEHHATISTHITSVKNRAAKEKERLGVLILELSPGPKRDEILERIRQLDASANIDKWLSSPGLQSPQ